MNTPNLLENMVETVIKLADALEVSLDELVGREGFRHP